MSQKEDFPGKDANGNPLEKFYTKKQAMKFLGVSKTLLYNYMKHDGLKSCGIRHNRRFHEDDLVEFFNRGRK